MKFDRIAPFYNLIERLTTGSQMQRGRLAHLDTVKEARRVLIVGEGNGRFLAECAAALPLANITVIDESPAMLRRAANRWQKAGGRSERVKFICSEFLAWDAPPKKFDLIVTHFFLDCFPPDKLRQLLTKLTLLTSANARWLLADFSVPASGPARWYALTMLRPAYTLFRWLADVEATELTSPDTLLHALGFQLLQRTHFDWKMIQSDLWGKS